MPRFCVECEGHVVCDFCTHFDFNGEDLPPPAKPGNKQLYVSKGWCRKHGRREDPGGGCQDFECQFGEELGWAEESPIRRA